MAHDVAYELRCPLAESTNNAAPRLRAREVGHVQPKPAQRGSFSTSYASGSSESPRPHSSEYSIFPAPVYTLSEALEMLPTTQTVVANGTVFDLLGTCTAIESELMSHVHYPHTLDPIIEQRSLSSLRDSPCLSLRQKRSVVNHLSVRHSPQVLRRFADARRKVSFSLTDLSLFKTLTGFLDTSRESSQSSVMTPVPTIRPTQPLHEPLHRPRTSKGLPTFNTPAARSYRLPSPRSLQRISRSQYFRAHSPRALRKLFRDRRIAHAALSEWRAQTHRLPRGAVMRGNDGTLVYGHWIPAQSGQTGHVLRSVAAASMADGSGDDVHVGAGNAGGKEHYMPHPIPRRKSSIIHQYVYGARQGDLNNYSTQTHPNGFIDLPISTEVHKRDAFPQTTHAQRVLASSNTTATGINPGTAMNAVNNGTGTSTGAGTGLSARMRQPRYSASFSPASNQPRARQRMSVSVWDYFCGCLPLSPRSRMSEAEAEH